MRGKFCYFGKVANDPKGVAALELWLSQKDELLAGRVPRAKGVSLTLHELCNSFCGAKERQVDAGDIGRRMFTDYHAVCKILLDCFGKGRAVDDIRADDLEKLRSLLANRYGPVALGNRIQRVRSVFKYAYDAGLIEAPIRFGPTFKRPAKRILRMERQKRRAFACLRRGTFAGSSRRRRSHSGP